MFGNRRGHRKKPLSSPFRSQPYGSESKGSQSVHYTGNVTKWGPFCGAAVALTGELGGNKERDANWLKRVQRAFLNKKLT